MHATNLSRRTLLRSATAAAASASLPAFIQAQASPASKLQLGLDAHSVRGMKWKAMPLIEYAAEQKVDAVLLNGFHYFEPHRSSPPTARRRKR